MRRGADAHRASSAFPKARGNQHMHSPAPNSGVALYEAIFRRRDIRNFIPDAVPDEVLARVIVAAHHAASVGFTHRGILSWCATPSAGAKSNASSSRSASATRRNSPASAGFLAQARRHPRSAAQPDHHLRARSLRAGVLGKVSIREVEVYSTCLAVGNLWLAARAEGLGVGWVSIVRNDALRIFSIPAHLSRSHIYASAMSRDFPIGRCSKAPNGPRECRRARCSTSIRGTAL